MLSFVVKRRERSIVGDTQALLWSNLQAGFLYHTSLKMYLHCKYAIITYYIFA
jgi:hypothetical protein